MKVLLSAYACAPNTGSEYDVGWNWSIQYAKKHEVWVLTKSENRKKIETWSIGNHLPDTLHILYIDIPQWAMKVSGRLGVLAKYIAWQWIMISKARLLCEEHNFSYVQHLTFATATLPMFLYRLNLPIVIGPAGGGERIPAVIKFPLTRQEQRVERQRLLMQKLPRISIFNRLNYKKASLILCTTEETVDVIPRKYRNKAVVMQTIGIDFSLRDIHFQKKAKADMIRILMAGRPLYWKGYNIGIEAFRLLRERIGNVELVVCGGLELQEEGIRCLGQIPYEEMIKQYADSDVLLNCSLHDSGCMVVLEAMSYGIPVVCIKTGGPAVLVDENSGIAVEPCALEILTNNIAEALVRLCQDSELRQVMGRNAYNRAREKFDYGNKIFELEQLMTERLNGNKQ